MSHTEMKFFHTQFLVQNRFLNEGDYHTFGLIKIKSKKGLSLASMYKPMVLANPKGRCFCKIYFIATFIWIK